MRLLPPPHLNSMMKIGMNHKVQEKVTFATPKTARVSPSHTYTYTHIRTHTYIPKDQTQYSSGLVLLNVLLRSKFLLPLTQTTATVYT